MKFMGGGSGIPDSNFHSTASDLRKLANIMDEAKLLGLDGLNNSGGLLHPGH
jgi:hypothetical protein